MATMVQQRSPVAAQQPRRGRLRWRNAAVGASFLLPNFLGFGLLTMVPIGYLFYLSFTNLNVFGRGRWVGTANFERLWHDGSFWGAFGRTFYYAGVHVPLTLVISLGLAVLLNRKLKGVAFFRTAAFFPYITSIVALTAVWNILLSPEAGPVNQMLRWSGIEDPPGWSVDADWSMPAVILVGTWRDMGYYMLLFLAGLQTIPGQLYEAATVDGASPWQRFWNVTVPGLRHTTFFVLVIMTINSLKVFDLILLMTGGGPGTSTEVLSQYIWRKSFGEGLEFGYSSAISIVLFAVCLLLTVIQYQINRRGDR
jgi:multiple sugar transport system permease protein